jgi:CubicO group peptidase (beta-lactamase class C family)
MILQESSMLSLDDPLLLYIPEFTSATGIDGDLEDVTLRRMTAHYSGLATEHPATDWDAPAFPQMQTMLDRIDEVQVVIPPDSAWKYSNMAYGFLGEVISRLSGQSYERFVASEILATLGMSETTFDNSAISDANRIVGYSQPSPSSDELRIAPYCDLNGVGPAGQVMTNVADLTKWLAHIMRSGSEGGTRLLDARSRREMLHPAYLDRDWTLGQCVAWRAIRSGERVYHGHGGGIHGFGTQTMFHVPYQTGIIVLTNLWPNAISVSLAQTLLDAVIDDWDEMPAVSTEVWHDAPGSDADSRLREFEGIYFTEPGFWMRLTAVSDAELRFNGHEASPYLLHAPASARLMPDGTFKIAGNRGAGERFIIEDGEFRIGGFRYRSVEQI